MTLLILIFHRGSNSGNPMYESKDLVHAHLQEVNRETKVPYKSAIYEAFVVAKFALPRCSNTACFSLAYS